MEIEEVRLYAPVRAHVRARVAGLVLVGLSLIPLTTAVFVAAAKLALGPVVELAMIVGGCTALGWIAAAAVARLTRPVERPTVAMGAGTARVEEGTLVLSTDEAVHRLALSTIVAARLSDQGDRVTIECDDGSIADLRSRNAIRLLSAIGWSPRARSVELPIAQAPSRIGAGCVVGAACFFTFAAALCLAEIVATPQPMLEDGGGFVFVFFAIPTPLLLLWAFLKLRRFSPGRVVIGRDGLRVGKKFYSLDDIARVQAKYPDLVLTLKDQREVVLRYGDRSDGLARRIRDVLSIRWRPQPFEQMTLERGDDSVATWKRRLFEMHSPDDYRATAGRVEELVDVLEDLDASPERRIGAALAIAGSRDEQAQAKVRIAADATADLDTRAALLEAAEGEVDEARLERLHHAHERT